MFYILKSMYTAVTTFNKVHDDDDYDTVVSTVYRRPTCRPIFNKYFQSTD